MSPDAAAGANAAVDGVARLEVGSPGVLVVAEVSTVVVRIEDAGVIAGPLFVGTWLVARPGRGLRLMRGPSGTRSSLDPFEALGTAVLQHHIAPLDGARMLPDKTRRRITPNPVRKTFACS